MESTLRKYLSSNLKHYGVFVTNVEDRANLGFPDTVGIPNAGRTFFIECKEMRHVPKKGDSMVPKSSRPRPTQISWLRQAWEKGAPAYVLLRVQGGRYYAFRGCDAGLFYTKGVDDLFRHAHRTWNGTIDFQELLETLK